MKSIKMMAWWFSRIRKIKWDKILAGRVSANGEHGGGKPTPLIHRGNMDKRSEFLDPWEERSSSNRDKKDKFPFLDIKIRGSPEGDLQSGVFRKKGKQLKYVGQEITHTPGTLHAIPSGVLNRLDKLAWINPSIHAEAVDNIYPAYANALRKAGLAPPFFLTMRYLLRKQDEKVDNEK